MDQKIIEDFDRKQKALKHKRRKGTDQLASKTKHLKTAQDERNHEPSTSYRDRAKERREGKSSDIQVDPTDLLISNPILDSNLLEPENEEERRRQQIEDSKYLGGEVEYTHLVKGLDFALLEKVKRDQKLAGKLAAENESQRDVLFCEAQNDSEDEELLAEALLAASSAAGSKKQLIDIEKLRKGKSTEIIPCRTAIARRILNVLDEKWPDKSELFRPGRMTYVIPINDDYEDSTVTRILRSKADTSLQDDGLLPTEIDFGLDKLIEILSEKRKPRGAAEMSKKLESWYADDYGY